MNDLEWLYGTQMQKKQMMVLHMTTLTTNRKFLSIVDGEVDADENGDSKI
jgi:hypothetical protein